MPLNYDVELRAARADDWPAAAELLAATGLPQAGAREHFSTFVLAFRGERLIACAGTEDYGADALLRSVAVAPSEQRSGIGRALVAHALARARGRGIRTLWLRTTTAADFFARFGFGTVALEAVPAALRASAEFNGACPASATVMRLALDPSRAAESPARASPDAGASEPSRGARTDA